MIRLKQLLQEDGERYLRKQSDENPFYTIDQNRDAVAYAFGETITGILSAGNNGMVYELASGKLMKITPDTSEVAAVMKLKRLPKMRHMISYYDVRNITNLFKRREVQKEPWKTYDPNADYKTEYETVPVTDFYAIIMNRVTPLNDEQKMAWKEHYEYFLEENDSLEEFFRNIYISDYPYYVKEFWRKVFPQRAQIQRDFKRAGINIYEAHSKNIGIDQFGQLVHFDPWIAGSGWNKPTIKKTRLNKSIELPTKYTTDGIDTPNDPTM